ncbi:MAG: aminoacyl-histidine dipeptidase [Clostridia bacterium]|nr:aminoacyl-histidine dipeptidase [Clostridia bacterium]
MNNVLKGLRPEKVFEIFELLCSVPHGSGNTRSVSDICVNFAADRGLRYYRDEINNVIIYKVATPGFENRGTVILQAHLDMVCTKNDDCDIDMTMEGPRVATDGEWVYAEGSSLGGDNGIGVATALAILDDDTIVHPPLEVLLTVDEETSLVGAGAVDVSRLKGRIMLNMDSEEEGVFTVSCAGGMRCDAKLPLMRETPPFEAAFFDVAVSGLKGGHSGADIDRGRGNALKLLGRFLYEASDAFDLRLESVSGGEFDNVIPKTASATVCVPAGSAEEFEELAKKYCAIFKSELAATDAGVTLTVSGTSGSAGEDTVLSSLVSDRLITAVYATPDGIQKMSPTIDGFVQTSLNLGVVRTSENFSSLSFSIRSSVYTEKYEVLSRLRAIITSLGGTCTERGEYPAWEYRPDSKIRETALKAYRNVYGGEARVEGIHAGLECGVFSERIKGLDAISFGPDLRNVHSACERLNVGSCERMYALVKEMLRLLCTGQG